MSDSSSSSNSTHNNQPAFDSMSGSSAPLPPSSIIRALNSLSRADDPVVPLVPLSPGRLSWYICGPTVYDSAHLGHARAYVTFDIIRRILTDYFHYDVLYVMNITDIDDKIISRARKNHLLKQYIQEQQQQTNTDTLIQLIQTLYTQALQQKQEQLDKTTALRDNTINSRLMEEIDIKINEQQELMSNLRGEFTAFQQSLSTSPSVTSLITSNSSILSDYLDAEKASSVFEHSIFSVHSQKYEKEFMEDMQMLNVREPTVLTRVTEYIDKIQELVQKIMDKGIAYHKNGSVYFSVQAFTQSTSPAQDQVPSNSNSTSPSLPHVYGKLSPSSVGNVTLAAEGEGQLFVSSSMSDKRHPSDFALWKASKPGEPSWSSPWGEGRPGWHIECFALDTRVLTDRGFLFIDEIEDCIRQSIPVHYACYDVSSQQLVYLPGQLVFPPGNTHQLLSFTQEKEEARWFDGSGDYGCTADEDEDLNHLSLRVTPNHDMYVQVLTEERAQKIPATMLHQYQSMSMLTCATGGIQVKPSSSVGFDTALGLSNEAAVLNFLQIYGFWLGGGHLKYIHCEDGYSYSGPCCHSLTFPQISVSEQEWIAERLRQCGLVFGVDWLVSENVIGGSQSLHLMCRAWVQYFHDEYFPLYLHTQPTEECQSVQAKHSPKWLWSWVLDALNKWQLRALIEGLSRADGGGAYTKKNQAGGVLHTSSVSFREELMIVLLHAGYSAHFDAANQSTPSWSDITWRVRYHDSSTSTTTASSGTSCTWLSLPSASVKSEDYQGRIWCVTVSHPDHLIVAQRAHRCPSGVVTKGSIPVIVGQCSAMATDIIGSCMDIHSGGIDLKFPHHDNELAQSEAALNTHQWVNHFWHAGHLSIKGLKMSKSLKNFITIRELLQSYTARQIRIFFLQSPWHAGISYIKDSLTAAKTTEKEFNEFFLNTQVTIRNKGKQNEQQTEKWDGTDRQMHKKLANTKTQVRELLSDNFNYPEALSALSSLIKYCNEYRSKHEATCKRLLLLSVASYVDEMLRVFGVISDVDPGFTSDSSDKHTEALLDAISAFRDDVRAASRFLIGKNALTAAECHERLMRLCDRFRDESMIECGVRLEDGSEPGKPSVWKREDVAKLKAERAQKQRDDVARKLRSVQTELIKLGKKQEKAVEGSTSASAYFRSMTDKYSNFSDSAPPTHDQAGEELSKSAKKNVEKLWKTREQAHNDYLAETHKNPHWQSELEREIERLEGKKVELQRLLDTDGTEG